MAFLLRLGASMDALLPLWNWLGPDLVAEIIISAAAVAFAAAGLRANKKKPLSQILWRLWACVFDDAPDNASRKVAGRLRAMVTSVAVPSY
jgi:hypothetical protein